jgi:RNA polymerase sigma factor (sigma-70 family)
MMITMNYNRPTFQTPVSHNSSQQRSGGKPPLDLLKQPLEKQMNWVYEIVNKFKLPLQNYPVSAEDVLQEALYKYYQIVRKKSVKETNLYSSPIQTAIVRHLNQYLKNIAEQSNVEIATPFKEHAKRRYIPPSSVDPQILDEGKVHLYSAPLPMDVLLKQDLEKGIASVLSELPERHSQVLKERFGLEDDIERSREQVGHVMNVSSERVRQLEAKAFTELRHPNLSRRLREYIE